MEERSLLFTSSWSVVVDFCYVLSHNRAGARQTGSLKPSGYPHIGRDWLVYGSDRRLIAQCGSIASSHHGLTFANSLILLSHQLQPPSDAMADANVENVEEHLQAIFSQSKNDTPDLKQAGDAFQAIANTLRLPTAASTRDELGKSELPEALVSFWKSALPDTNSRPTGAARTCILELLRVAANLCNDNDPNRQRLLDVGLLQLLLPMLSAYSQEGIELELEDLKVTKTSLGAVFMRLVRFIIDTLRTKLIEMDAPLIVLKLSNEIYEVGSWTKTISGDEEPESWTWRSGLSGWTRRLLESLLELGRVRSEPTPKFGPSVLPYLLKPLDIFSSQGSRTPTATHNSTSKSTVASPPDLIAADLEALEASCTLLESLALDSEVIRLAIASDANLLRIILRFIEFAQPLPEWRTNDSTGKDNAKWDKKVGLCKGAVIKALVTVAGEDRAISSLWDDTKLDGGNQAAPGGWFVAAMLAWIKQYRNVDPSDARDDLVICATLTLGNLARRDEYCVALVAPPSSIVPDLVPFITPATDMKVKHGVLGLLKHLAQPVPNKIVLGDAGVLEALSASGVWDSESDRAEAVQASAVGIAKHLCLSNVSNTLRLVLPPPTAQPTTPAVASPVIDDDDDEPSGMDQVINLSQRSDTVALKSEAARVLVNAVKSLWSPAGPEESIAVSAGQRKRAIRRLSNRQSTRALAELVGRSRKYPVLLNEGIVALTLLGSQHHGAPYVISAYDRALDVPMAVVTGNKSSVEEGGTLQHPKLIDMLSIILKNEDKVFPPQLRANVCTLFASVSSLDAPALRIIEKVKRTIKPILSDIVAADKEEPVVQTAAKKILDTWAES
ncbi:small GTPase mediated signal transduction, partial [Rhizoctonia solani]